MTTIELLKTLITFRSLTPDDDGAFDFIQEYLSDFDAFRIDKNNVKNLLLTRRFGEGLHLAFAGHIDVVPEGNGWESDPFVPLVQDGYLYGRGTQDMKSGMAAFLHAVRNVERFNGTISLILTSDEEGDGVDGTDVVLAWMRDRGELPDMCVVAEPTCETVFGDAIKVGRRGSVNGEIVITGQGGHAAYPEKADNPIEAAARLLPLLSGVELDRGDEFFQPSRLVMTTIRSGRGTTNVIPHDLTLLFNVRNNTLTSRDAVEAFVRQALQSAGIGRYELTVSQSSKEFVTKEGPYSAMLVGVLETAIRKVTGVTPKRSTAGGTSDARYVAAYGIDVVEFGVINDTIHAPNERVGIDEVEKLREIFASFITEVGK